MQRNDDDRPPELPEGRPLPHEANPGGTEGAAGEPFAGGSSNVGEVIHEEPEVEGTYSTDDAGTAGQREDVRPDAR